MRLNVLSGPQTGRSLRVGEPLTVGRSPDRGLILDDPKVSRRHATVHACAGELRLRDDGSLNGTWLNDRRIDREHALRPGDRIRIGSSEIIVQSDEQAGEHDPLISASADDRHTNDERTTVDDRAPLVAAS